MLSVTLTLATALLALVRFLQDVDPTASLTMTGVLLYLATPGIAGYLATFIYGGIKTILPFYDRLPANVHMIAAPVISFLFGYYVVGKLALPAIGDVHSAGLDYYLGASTSLINAGIFRFFKRKAPVDATVALKASRESGVTA